MMDRSVITNDKSAEDLSSFKMNATKNMNLLKRLLLILSLKGLDFGGLIIRARHSPSRDLVMKIINAVIDNFKVEKIYPWISDQQLYGGLDFAATIQSKQAIYSQGIFNDTPKFIKIAMAEKLDGSTTAKITQAIDNKLPISFIIIDEGSNKDEGIPLGLLDRIPYFLNLEHVPFKQIPKFQINPKKIKTAQTFLPSVEFPSEYIEDLIILTNQLGLNNFRPVLFCLDTAQSLAAFRSSLKVEKEDILESIALTISHKAQKIPENAAEEENNTSPSEPDENENDKKTSGQDKIPLEMMIDAIRTMLPKEILEKISYERGIINKKSPSSSGSGQKKISFLRGRPLPSRKGTLSGRNRIDVIGTIRSAAPWQAIRNGYGGVKGSKNIREKRIKFKSEDIRIRRFQDMLDRLIIFSVDASGSLAIGRLAEAKGAVELLLSKAYASRDQVALIAFRGESAEVLLSPTKSLVKTKRALSSLPGGGGTPLASGLEKTLTLALEQKNKGVTPMVVILTDGKANIDLAGGHGREGALSDSNKLASLFIQNNLNSIVIDTSNRKHLAAEQLSNRMGASYIFLPRANAFQLSNTVMDKLN